MWPFLTQSYWRDEAFSVLLASRPIQDIFSLVVNFDHTPPLFYYLQHFWLWFFGNGEVAARSLSLVFLLAAAAIVYRLSRSRLAVLAMVCNPLLWEYAHEARHYSFYLVLTLAAVYAYYRKKIILSNTLWVLAMWAHNFSWLYFGVFWLIVRDWRLLVAPLAGSFWLPFAWKQVQSLDKEMWLTAPQGFWWWLESLKVFFGNVWIGLLVILFLFIKPNRWSILALTPPLLTYIISRFWVTVYLERYLLPSVGFALIYLGRRRWFKPVLVVLLVFQLIIFIPMNFRITKPDMRETSAQIAARLQPDEIVVTEQPINFLEVYYYFDCLGAGDRLYSYLYPGEDHIPDYVGVELIKPETEILAIPAGKPYWLVKPDGSVLKYD